MHDYPLNVQSPLDGYARSFADIQLVEVSDLSLYSLAVPFDRREVFTEYLLSEYQCTPPLPGKISTSQRSGAKIVWMQSDLYFLLFYDTVSTTIKTVSQEFQGMAYTSEQSDSWVYLRLQGQGSITALERICPLDLQPQSFPIHSVSRTVMEHMPTIILSEDNNQFLLMGLRSSALSFLHAVETSIENTQ